MSDLRDLTIRTGMTIDFSTAGALNAYVLIHSVKNEGAVSANGVILPESQKTLYPQGTFVGRVVSVGPKCNADSGVKVGAKVLYCTPRALPIDDKSVVVPETDILLCL